MIQDGIDKLQKIPLFRRIRAYSKDSKTMVDMKMQLDAVTMPYAVHPSIIRHFSC